MAIKASSEIVAAINLLADEYDATGLEILEFLDQGFQRVDVSEEVGVGEEVRTSEACPVCGYTGLWQPSSVGKVVRKLHLLNKAEFVAALLDALLRERGYEKRWYIETEDGRMHRAKSERKARIAVKAWKRGRAVEVAVPVQREEPDVYRKTMDAPGPDLQREEDE